VNALRRHPWRTVALSVVLVFVLFLRYVTTGTGEGGVGVGLRAP
jgi:hypothetical protein